MEPKDNETQQNNNAIQFLNKKRNKKKNLKQEKINKDSRVNLIQETTLEIKKLFDNTTPKNYIEEEKNEIIEYKDILTNKVDSKKKEYLLLLIKRTYINFNTPESLFIKGRKDPDEYPEQERYNHYYCQRFYFFSLFDKGIQMDKESWYSVTPEEISEYMASIIQDSPNSTILDAFCGCGGNVISFSKKFKKVFANDLFQEKINMTKNNTKIYNCPNNIVYYTNDFLKLNLGKEKIDYVFLSPPWGGPEYKNETAYSLKKWIMPDIDNIIQKSLSISENIMIYLPRNTDLEELANIIYKYDRDNIESLSNTILFDVKYLNSASKIKGILVLYGPKFNSLKVKLIKKYIIDSLFQKNSNKINQNKVEKQLDILKVIGYSDYIRNFVMFKDIKKDFSGNIFLENLEQFFLENILDEKEKEEFFKLYKKDSLNEGDNINIINNKTIYDDKIMKEKLKFENEFIDLRQILTKEKFNEVKNDVF